MGNQINFEIQLKFQDLIEKYNIEVEMPSQELLKIINKYEIRILDEYSRNEFLNLKLANNLIIVFKTLCEEYDNFDISQKKYFIAALRYFVDTEDTDDDFESFFGFEDDAEVVNEMLVLINREDLIIEFQLGEKI